MLFARSSLKPPRLTPTDAPRPGARSSRQATRRGLRSIQGSAWLSAWLRHGSRLEGQAAALGLPASGRVASRLAAQPWAWLLPCCSPGQGPGGSHGPSDPGVRLAPRPWSKPRETHHPTQPTTPPKPSQTQPATPPGEWCRTPREKPVEPPWRDRCRQARSSPVPAGAGTWLRQALHLCASSRQSDAQDQRRTAAPAGACL